MTRRDEILAAQALLDATLPEIVEAPVLEGTQEVLARVAGLRGVGVESLRRGYLVRGLRRDLGDLFAEETGEAVPENTKFDGSLAPQFQAVRAALESLSPEERESAERALHTIYAWLEVQGARAVQLYNSLRTEDRGGYL